MYKLSIGLKKAGVDVIIAILTGLILVWQDDVKYIALIPLLKLILNWVKHK